MRPPAPGVSKYKRGDTQEMDKESTREREGDKALTSPHAVRDALSLADIVNHNG